MSLSQNLSLACPHCGAAQSVAVYSSVNITIDPSLKEKVLKGTLNSKACTSCHKTISVETALLYHDMLNKFIISLDLSEGDEDNVFTATDNPFREQKGYIIRQVKTYPELYEKIMIFDHKLNDIAVEKIAVEYKEMFKQVVEDTEMHVFFSKVEKSLFSKKIVFNCFSHPDQMMQLKQPVKKLDKQLQAQLYDLDALRTN